ncbi:hypothetical protein LCGC14_2015800 [marine sediment metagenome]|uniref:Uncharacterized protein n=1 Tax=marine sediment metagenome TaxID=412755 RepID=A0A0F9FLG9_9ZZZZ
MVIPDLGHLSIHTKPDKETSLIICNGRFEVPAPLADLITFPYIVSQGRQSENRAEELFDKIVYEAGNQVIAANRKRDYHFRGEYGVKVELSKLQLDMYEFGDTTGKLIPAVNQGDTLLNGRNTVACIIKMAFTAPKIRIEVLEPEELNEPDGFVEEMPKVEDGIFMEGIV